MYVSLSNLEVYSLARELSRLSWVIYSRLHWSLQKDIGSQFIRSVDSVGANIAEGYGRYHYLDKIKFYYNARGSLYESVHHWLELLLERDLIVRSDYDKIKEISNKLEPKLNNFINSNYNAKTKNQTKK